MKRILSLAICGLVLVCSAINATAQSKKLNQAQVIYLQRLSVINNDYSVSLGQLGNSIDEAQKVNKGIAPKKSWIDSVQVTRKQLIRLRSITPVPISLSKADRSYGIYSVMMEELLNGIQQWFYDKDEIKLNIQAEAAYSVANDALNQAKYEIKRITGQTPKAPVLSLPKKEYSPD